MNASAPPSDIKLLVLTMPGFGVETLRRLDLDPGWPSKSVVVGMIGPRPSRARSFAASVRLRWRNLKHPLAGLAEAALAAMEARRWLASRRYECLWLERDDDVHRARTALAPHLTMTITSRIIFTERTIRSGSGEWLNVHPGLLPDYAGASPVPYMFLHGTAGCTIHRMEAGIDAGPVVDIAQVDGDLGADGGTLLYELLPRLAAERIVEVLQHWRDGTLAFRNQDVGALKHWTSAQLRRDRQLNWSWEAPALARWVRALMPYAPAYFLDRSGRHREVRAAFAHTEAAVARPGVVLEKRGHSVRVACRDGSVWLECCLRPNLSVGDELAGSAAR